MSAYMVTDNHITVMVRAALRFNMASLSTADLIGQALRQANAASVSARYRFDWHASENSLLHHTGTGVLLNPVDDITHTQPGTLMPATYRYQPRTEGERPLDLDRVMAAIKCYEYQSCEQAGWATSAAHDFCAALKGRIAARHQDDPRPPGFSGDFHAIASLREAQVVG